MKTGFGIQYLLLAALITIVPAVSQNNCEEQIKGFTAEGLSTLGAYAALSELCTTIGPRLSGSENYQQAVEWGRREMVKRGFDSVWLEPVMIPHWVRGEMEQANLIGNKERTPLNICALGGSIGTSSKGITGKVIEVRSFDELKEKASEVKGAVVFYNRPFDKTLVSTGAAYGGAVDQRSRGAIEAARFGAVAVLVRSMTNALDDYPHTGMMNYQDSITKIPAAAISTIDADYVSEKIRTGKTYSIHLTLSCQTLPDVASSNVVGEIRGSEHPEEVIVLGGHLDSWDKGQGAHDDGSGCVQAIEAVSLFKRTGITPKRTIRVVLFANEENGARGGKEYAKRSRPNTRHIAAIESDMGGFQPRGFGISADSAVFGKILQWRQYFENIRTAEFTKGGGGVDIGPLRSEGAVLLGLYPDSQRYFDYHHSDHDTIDKVHPRELELGAIAMASMAYLISEQGLSVSQ